MQALIGPYWAICLLLLAAGAAKLRSPSAVLSEPMARFGVRPGARWPARVSGAVELVVGAAGLVPARAAVVPVVLAYLVLTGSAVHLLRTRPGADCGCFGAVASPIGATHVVVDAVAVTAAVVVAVAGIRPAALDPATLVVLAGLAVVLAVLARLLLTTRPELLRLRALVESPS